MAESKEKKPSFFARIKKYFRDTAGEVRKIVWPTRKAVVNNTVIVLTTVVIFAVVIWVLDFGFAQIRNVLIDLVVKMVGE